LDKKLENLVNAGFSYLGMINEAKIRCDLLKNSIENYSKKNNLSSHFFKKTNNEIKKIKDDINKYNSKIKEIYQEFKLHGILSEME
jgi:methyl-accepting chemotaxis protein